MLFNSPAFIFGFAPIVLLGFFLVARLGRQAALAWLTAASLFFYGWWNPAWVPLLLASILFNFIAGIEIARRAASCIDGKRTASPRALLILAVSVDLGLLIYYKYAAFFAGNIGALLGIRWRVPESELASGDLVLHLHPDRVSGGRLGGKAREYNLDPLRAVRDPLSRT